MTGPGTPRRAQARAPRAELRAAQRAEREDCAAYLEAIADRTGEPLYRLASHHVRRKPLAPLPRARRP